jgi:hypothetical protein
MCKFLRIFALVAAVITGQACYKGRVVAFQPLKKGEPPRDVPEGTFDKTQKVSLYFWGLLQKPPSPVLAENCVTGSLKEVTVTRKGGYVAAAVFTLGIYSAIDVSWQCAVQPQKQGGDIGETPHLESNPLARSQERSIHADR